MPSRHPHPALLSSMALLAVGCQRLALPPADDAPPTVERYTVTALAPTERGQVLVEATALCDDGDEVIAGGCVWGSSEDPADLPLYPVVDAPAGVEGWRCRGRNGGVGTTLEPLVATAICEARS